MPTDAGGDIRKLMSTMCAAAFACCRSASRRRRKEIIPGPHNSWTPAQRICISLPRAGALPACLLINRHNSERATGSRRWLAMPKQSPQPSNGTPGKKPPAPSVKLRPGDFRRLVEMLNGGMARRTDQADQRRRSKIVPARPGRG